ncbi:citrate transporter [Clostridium estertheticum]|uniref:citrate transporter n=1 Tax=Clostridium estertheticum TaxID=238834 RepID=UPI001C0BA0FD|nr:citrate transporter [Clostridium estertheticum]MBU3215156.1 citrate transporter [Clostridium estertheticum]WAG55556.1 citrate transporter [Clostridium estertheticum]
MLQTVIGILLLLSYVIFAIYAAKGGNLMIGFFVMAVLWCVLGSIAGVVNWDTINAKVFQGGPEGYGGTVVIIIFGSWFGRVMLETGIAKTIITKAVELGGDNPAVATILLVLVTSIIFTSSYGAGAVIAIGVIVFPIMLSLGIPKPVAVSAFVMAVGAGMYLNMAQLSQMVVLVPGYKLTDGYYTFGFMAFGVQLVVIIIMILISTRKSKLNHAWAAQSNVNGDSGNGSNLLSLLTPLIPVVLSIFFGWKSIPSLILAILFAFVTTGKIKNFTKFTSVVQKTFYDGVCDVAMVFAFLFFLQMFVKSAGACSVLLKPIISPLVPHNSFILFLGFGVFSILGLFRGPLTAWGAGTATLAMMQSTGMYSAAVLFPLFYIPSVSMNISCCPTQSWNLWSINFVKINVKQFMRSITFWGWLVCLINSMLAYFILV